MFADKGRYTLLDGYTGDEFVSVCHELWAQDSSSSECHFRMLVDILLGHYMLTRGGDRRSAEISHLFTFEFKGEAPYAYLPREPASRISMAVWRPLKPCGTRSHLSAWTSFLPSILLESW
jgi:hypothetical protein